MVNVRGGLFAVDSRQTHLTGGVLDATSVAIE